MNTEYKKISRLVLALILVVGLVLVIFYQTKINSSASSESTPVSFVIEKGSSARLIAHSLEEHRIIHDPNIFLIYVYLHNAKTKIQAGVYELDATMPITEIVDIITKGQVVESDRRVTILEGWTNTQIATYLENRKISSFSDALKKGNFDFKFNDTAEDFGYLGFLFPDTYTLSVNDGAEELIQKMLNNFENKLTDEMLKDIESQNRKLSDVMILASIIEKEVGRNKESLTAEDLKTMQEERRLVASVFYNRLEIGMALESDATVNFVTGKKDRSVTIEDTKIKSAYNTYANRGLPPTPISNPGIGSIEAAINPANSDYLYFLNSPDGKAYFARTLEEHGQNRVKYLR